MIQVLTIPALFLMNMPGLTMLSYGAPMLPGLSPLSGPELSVVPPHDGWHIVTATEEQGGSTHAAEALQLSVDNKVLQNAPGGTEAPITSTRILQNAPTRPIQ